MKTLYRVIMCFLALCMLLSLSATASAPRLVDNAALLSDDEETMLLARLDAVSEQYRMDVVIVTTNSTNGKSPMAYADDFYDDNGYGFGAAYDGVLLLISMEDRDWWISTCGAAIDAFDGATIDRIGEKMLDDLSVGWYADAFETFVDECEYYIDGAINGFPFNFGFHLVVALVIGLIAALIVTGIMRAQLRSVRRQAAASDYTKQNSMKITGANELFLYRNVTCVRKSSSSGGSGTHHSSSGRSHGGGGGRF